MNFRPIRLATLAAALCASLPAGTAPADAAPTQAVPIEPIAGYDRFDIRVDHRAVLVAGSIWYPATARTFTVPVGDNGVFEGTPALLGAAAAKGKHPLILLSHGSGGNMDGLGWLSSQLALRGALVVAVNHPGTTSGDSSPRRLPRIDQRAKDLSAALDAVLANPSFGPLVDQSRISALGFSLGGTTVLDLAGGQYERAKFRTYCQTFSQQEDCVFYRRGSVDFDHLPQEMEADVRDPRVSAIVAIDPDLTGSLSDKSIRAMKLPIQLINLGAPAPFPGVDVSAAGSNLVARLPDATHEMIRPAGHFTFLGLCKPGALQLLEEAQEDPICTDPAGSDRAAIHAKAVDAIARFLGLTSAPGEAKDAHQ
ncbi:alpha/beta hydrolase family protein [Jiella mangrovi]|uniref:Dienelactone hydrolase n=1 Tax=Jiella mangrovi TaxID=2821407 RepID=A0ABS4BMS1_9HYPH|nr:hypothetical protein [Jiella mangrovi]MBP0617999.1 hypothetical protein [Jiella mangrovi]